VREIKPSRRKKPEISVRGATYGYGYGYGSGYGSGSGDGSGYWLAAIGSGKEKK
jgi:hypothetical protein